MQRINRLNTLFFGDDLEYLISVKERVLSVLDEKKDNYTYEYSIYANEKGWFLNVNIYHIDSDGTAKDL